MFKSLTRELSDHSKDGRFDLEEFILAMFLTEKARAGLPLPQKLPPNLIPNQQQQTSFSSQSSTVKFCSNLLYRLIF